MTSAGRWLVTGGAGFIGSNLAAHSAPLAVDPVGQVAVADSVERPPLTYSVNVEEPALLSTYAENKLANELDASAGHVSDLDCRIDRARIDLDYAPAIHLRHSLRHVIAVGDAVVPQGV